MDDLALFKLSVDMELIETESLRNCEVFRSIFINNMRRKDVADKYNLHLSTVSRIYRRCLKQIEKSKLLKNIYTDY